MCTHADGFAILQASPIASHVAPPTPRRGLSGSYLFLRAEQPDREVLISAHKKITPALSFSSFLLPFFLASSPFYFPRFLVSPLFAASTLPSVRLSFFECATTDTHASHPSHPDVGVLCSCRSRGRRVCCARRPARRSVCEQPSRYGGSVHPVLRRRSVGLGGWLEARHTVHLGEQAEDRVHESRPHDTKDVCSGRRQPTGRKEGTLPQKPARARCLPPSLLSL